MGAGLAFIPDVLFLWQGSALLLGATAFADWHRQRNRPTPEVQRRLNRNLPVGVWSTVTLEVRNSDTLPLHCDLHDLHPSQFEVLNQPRSLKLVPDQWAEVSYQVRPPTRGSYQMSG